MRKLIGWSVLGAFIVACAGCSPAPEDTKKNSTPNKGNNRRSKSRAVIEHVVR